MNQATQNTIGFTFTLILRTTYLLSRVLTSFPLSSFANPTVFLSSVQDWPLDKLVLFLTDFGQPATLVVEMQLSSRSIICAKYFNYRWYNSFGVIFAHLIKMRQQLLFADNLLHATSQQTLKSCTVVM